MTTYRITHTDGTTESIHETFAHAIARLRRKYDALVMVTRDGGDVTPESDPAPGTEILVWTSEDDAQDDDGARAVASIYVGVRQDDEEVYGIDDEDGSTLTAGVCGYRKARSMAQEMADERGGAVSLYAIGSLGAETVEPAEYASAEDAETTDTPAAPTADRLQRLASIIRASDDEGTIQADDMVRLFPGRPTLHTATGVRNALGEAGATAADLRALARATDDDEIEACARHQASTWND